MILLLGASLSYYMQNPGSVAKRREVQLAPELQERVALALMWMVARPFSRGEPAPQQESLEYQMRVPGEITRNISDKLIRAGLLSLAGRNGDQLVPGRALDLITVGNVLQAVRRDEDRVVERLPVQSMPERLLELSSGREDVSFSELLR